MLQTYLIANDSQSAYGFHQTVAICGSLVVNMSGLKKSADQSKDLHMSNWSINGEYMETCNCTFLCPCITSNLAGRPTEGDCKAALTLRIDKGVKDGVKLDGLSFIVMMHSPGAMGDGNIKVGLIIDERASDEQVEAISAIATDRLADRWRHSGHWSAASRASSADRFSSRLTG